MKKRGKIENKWNIGFLSLEHEIKYEKDECVYT